MFFTKANGKRVKKRIKNFACLDARHCAHVIYDEDLRRVEQNPADNRYHLLSEYFIRNIRLPEDRVSVVQETGDEHE